MIKTRKLRLWKINKIQKGEVEKLSDGRED